MLPTYDGTGDTKAYLAQFSNICKDLREYFDVMAKVFPCTL
jgi:hypothetical protein